MWAVCSCQFDRNMCCASILGIFVTPVPAMSSKIDRIRSALGALCPIHLELCDESRQHRRGQESHYRAVVVCAHFSGQPALQRHQQVYRALGALMGEIHALALHTYSPEEWADIDQAPDSPRCRGGSQHDQAAVA